MQNEIAEPHSDIFFDVIAAFEQAGVLCEMVLIGSWCLLLYKHHFGEDVVIPAVLMRNACQVSPRKSLSHHCLAP